MDRGHEKRSVFSFYGYEKEMRTIEMKEYSQGAGEASFTSTDLAARGSRRPQTRCTRRSKEA